MRDPFYEHTFYEHKGAAGSIFAEITDVNRYTMTGKELLHIMEWSTPQFEEVCLSCEIASYANPEI